MTAARGLPGLRGVDHIGITVPDLEAACTWLIDVLGCEYMYSLGPYQDPTGSWMTDHLNVHPRAVMEQLQFLRCGPITLEVFQYLTARQIPIPPRNSDVGGHHIALYVDDLDAAVAHLRRHNVEVLGEPTTSTGPSAGQRWVYFLAPWGLQMEMVSYPGGKAFDREGTTS